MRIFPELGATGDVRRVNNRFWHRQFQRQSTKPQVAFDLAFGVVFPVLCFIFDPIVFQGGLLGRPLFPEYQTFMYLFSGIQMVVLCLWLVTGAGSELANALLGGALMVGATFCLGIGVLLFPFSVLGLMYFGIGVFGFIPFLTAHVYLRNGWRALRSPVRDASSFTCAMGATCGLLLVAAIPVVLSMQIRLTVAKSVDYIVRADPVHAPHAAQQLAVLRFLASNDLERIVEAYSTEIDENRKQLLNSYYREITGEDIESHRRFLD